MTPAKHEKTTSPENHSEPQPITEGDVEQMQQIFEEAKKTVKPIVKRELTAEIISVDLLNIRLKYAYRT